MSAENVNAKTVLVNRFGGAVKPYGSGAKVTIKELTTDDIITLGRALGIYKDIKMVIKRSGTSVTIISEERKGS